MNKAEVLHRIALACIFLAVGISIGEDHRGKGTFFRSWYGDDKELYYGESVKVNQNDSGATFYNSNCKKMTVVGLQATKNYNAAWVYLEECSNIHETEFFDVFDQRALEKR